VAEIESRHDDDTLKTLTAQGGKETP
jgi:hypothetical protein